MANVKDVASKIKRVRLSQREAARLQIDRACKLMLSEQDYVSVVTLACAADGILGEHLAAIGGEAFVTTLKRLLKEKFVPEMPDKELNDQHINLLRNFLKHKRSDLDEFVELPLEQEAINALLRAIGNYAVVSSPVSDPMRAFLTWLKQTHGHLLDVPADGGI